MIFFLCVCVSFLLHPLIPDKPVFSTAFPPGDDSSNGTTDSDDKANGNLISLVEGRPATVNMTAAANPAQVSYVWVRQGDSEDEVVPEGAERRRVRAEGGLLVIREVRREDEGVYEVQATNAEGAAQTRFRIRVLFPPRIVGITQQLLVGQREPAHLECAVHARPLRPETIRWQRAGPDADRYDMDGRTKTTQV